jgi:osmoprotectant transport system ATP-binding protein
MIEFQQVSKQFANCENPAVDQVSFTANDNEILVLLGSSGSGKTTSLKMINRLIEPTSGKILLDGENVLEQDLIQLRRNIGYVFQRIGLFPHLTISENISIVLKLLGKSKTERQQRAAELLEIIGLPASEYAERYPAELSGGQQQRVGVARALAANPKHLLMDEPFGALDAITRVELQEEILKIKQRFNTTIIFVTHDIAEALKLADRIAVMHAGKLEQIDTTENILNKPSSEFVAQLFKTHAQQAQDFMEAQQ